MGKETVAKPVATVDFSIFEKSAELRKSNLAREQAERDAELGNIDVFGEYFPEAQTPAIKLASSNIPKRDVPDAYRFENKQEYAKKAQDMIYAGLGIDPVTEKNDWEKKFLKGLIDGAALSNADFVEEIIRDPGKIIEALKNIDVIAMLE